MQKHVFAYLCGNEVAWTIIKYLEQGCERNDSIGVCIRRPCGVLRRLEYLIHNSIYFPLKRDYLNGAEEISFCDHFNMQRLRMKV